MAGKLGPIIEKLKAKLPAGLASKGGVGVRRGVTFFKLFGIGVVSLIFALVATTVVWFKVHPLNGYRPFIANYLREKLGADELLLGDISWKINPSRLAIGVSINDLSFRRESLLNRFQSPHFEISILPWKALFGKLPLMIESQGGSVALKNAKGPMPAEVAAENAEQKEGQVEDEFQRWLKKTSVVFHLKDISINVDPKLFSHQDEQSASSFFFEVKDVQGSVDGIPGPFKAHLTSQLDFEWNDGKGQILGPAETDLIGSFQTITGQPTLGARIDAFHADLSKTKITSRTFLDKRTDQTLVFDSKVEVVFNEKFLISKIDLTHGQLKYEELPVSTNVHIDTTKQEVSMDWDSGRREVKQLRFPLKKISNLPFKGNFESTGSLRIARDIDPMLNAKFALNNFRLNMHDLVKEDAVDPESRGDVLFSLVSETLFKDGTMSSPRFELQVDGTDAQIELQGGRFVKPRGDSMTALLKGRIADKDLDFETAKAKINNLDFDSRVKIEDFDSFFRDQKGAELQVDFKTNPVNLTEWSSYLPWFRKIPLQGLVEAAGTFQGPIRPGDMDWDQISWRVDRFSLGQVRGSFETQNIRSLGFESQNLKMNGPFSIDVLFQGRGRGPVIQKAYLISLLDLNSLDLRYKDVFHKPPGQALSLDLAAEQTQNKLTIRRGTLKMIDNSVLLSGNVIPGSSRNTINVKLDKPLKLETWRPFFASLPDGFPKLGKASFEGKLGFGARGSYEQSLDWSQFGFDGYVLLEDISLQAKPFAYPVENLTGGFWVEGNKLLYPNLKFAVKDSRFTVSGESSLLSSKKDQGNIATLLGNESPWSVAAQISVDRFNENILGDQSKEPAKTNMVQGQTDFLNTLREFVKSPRSQKSRLDLRFSAREAGASKIKSRNLVSMVKWNGTRLTMDPVSAHVMGGRMRGSFVYDAVGYYQRKDPPQVSLTASLEDMNLGGLAALYNPQLDKNVAGSFNGDVRLAADGFDVEAMRDTVRGRIKGRATAFDFAPLQSLSNGINVLVKSSDAADYVNPGSDAGLCLSGEKIADVDANLDRGKLLIERFALRTEHDSRLNALGSVASNGALELRGKFLAGPTCLIPKASACLDDRVLTFALGENVKKPKLQFDVEKVGRKIASCMSESTDREVRRAIDDESRPNSKVRAQEKALSEKIRRSIQGKSKKGE